MEFLLVRCLYCGPFVVKLDSAVDELHAHTASQGHRDLVALDKELNALFYLGER